LTLEHNARESYKEEEREREREREKKTAKEKKIRNRAPTITPISMHV